jgi:hypothetical protein
MTALVETANAAKGRPQARAVLNLADPGTSPDSADPVAAMADFPALTLIGAPIRRRKAFASAAAHGLLVDELSHVDMTAVQDLSALTRWCLAVKVIWRQYEHHQKTISNGKQLGGIGAGREATCHEARQRPAAIDHPDDPAQMMNRLDALAEQTGQTRAGLLLGASRVLRDGI